MKLVIGPLRIAASTSVVSRVCILALALLGGVSSIAPAQGSGALDQEVVKLRQAGEFDRAVSVALQAVAVAEHKVGPDHPSLAKTLNSLAALYRVQG